jgi:hypothetical protein
MPKRLLLVLGVAALAIAACNSGNSPAPTPSYTPGSPSPNPSITKATIEVTISGTPAARIPVEASTPKNPQSPRPGTPFETVNTGKKGLAHFNHLKYNKVYCWVALIAPSIKSSECAGWAVWQNSTIFLGT